MDDLISVNEAQKRISQHLPAFASERVALDMATGRVLRQNVYAERDQPPFDRVMMDGIAIAAKHGSRRSFLPAAQQYAGMPSQQLVDAEHCIEVSTGAMLPRGAHSIIPIEQTRRDGEHFVLAEGYEPKPGQFIHPRAADCHQGDLLLEPGLRLGATAIAVLAANGVAEVEVAAIPSIAIIATGDELAGVDQPLAEGQIRRSNDHALATALRSRGFNNVRLSNVGDDLAATTQTMAELLQTHQVLLLSGGVSMGQHDFVPEALRALGVQKIFHGIAQRPGKPMWFGVGPDGQAVFALPGNPLSVLVCAFRHVLPALQRATGLRSEPSIKVSMASTVATHPTFTCFVPVQVHHDERGCAIARPMPAGTSGDFSRLPNTHGFVQLAPGAIVEAGSAADFYIW